MWCNRVVIYKALYIFGNSFWTVRFKQNIIFFLSSLDTL